VQHIIDLWSGRITRRDDALRLLLIVDYIFDWARDLYRPTIYRDLKIHAASDNSSLWDDSDIFSVADQVRTWLNEPRSREESAVEAGIEQDNEAPQSLLALDSEYGWIRHASIIQTLLLGLYITKDSLEDLLQSFPTPLNAEMFARDVLQAMKKSSRTNADALDALEVKWTGNYRPREESGEPQAIFYVTFALTAYMSPLWDQVRELSYLAVAEDAVGPLLGHANLAQAFRILPEEHPVIEQRVIESFCERVQSASLIDNLHATICCASLTGNTTADFIVPEWEVRSILGAGFTFNSDNAGRIHNIVAKVYSLVKIGRREPSEPFLRISKRHDKQTQEAASSFRWTLSQYQPTFGDGVVLIDFSANASRPKIPIYCFHIVNGPSDVLDTWSVVEMLQKALGEGSIYQVRRRDLKPATTRSPRWHNFEVSKLDEGRHYRVECQKWLAHLTHIAERTTQPRISSAVQAYEDVTNMSQPSILPIGEAQVDTSQRSTSTTRPDTDTSSDVNEEVQILFTRTLRPESNRIQGDSSRKRQSDFFDETYDVEAGPSKCPKTSFDSDYLTDEALQQLIEDKYFGEMPSNDEPGLIE
jgi:hypothetical protein